ncbi:hypothetical protein [Aeromicrobium sp.]|uniref:hypothetical protein n=1 Tax=Aeromicrobium sp. TaxID=1871063 RepID=UPI002FC5913C
MTEHTRDALVGLVADNIAGDHHYIRDDLPDVRARARASIAGPVVDHLLDWLKAHDAEVAAAALREAATAYGHYAQRDGAEVMNWLRARATSADEGNPR